MIDGQRQSVFTAGEPGAPVLDRPVEEQTVFDGGGVDVINAAQVADPTRSQRCGTWIVMARVAPANAHRPARPTLF